MNGKKNRNRKMHNTKFNIYGNVHRYTIKPERMNTQPKPMYDDNAETMAKYHRDVILALARRYTDKKVLLGKLAELSWCSVETALEVIKNEGK